MTTYLHCTTTLMVALVVLWLLLPAPCSARPADGLNSLDNDYYRLSGKPLPSGYYFVDKGYISALDNGQQLQLKAAQRKDTSAKTVKFKPLLKLKQTHTKKKKLFVPNLFG